MPCVNSFAEDDPVYHQGTGCGILTEDEHLEKRLKNQVKKCGVRMLSAVFWHMTPQESMRFI